VDASHLPEGATLTVGRDGTPTALHVRDGETVWFGQSSMPRVTTEVQLDGAAIDPGSIWVPGILTGLEPLGLLDRLAPQFAVFVIERHPKLVKLAMQLHDYAGAIRTGRLLFFPEDDLEGAVVAFFTAHPGYEVPPHLLTAWQYSADGIGALRRRLESVVERVDASRAERVGEWLRAIHASERGDLEETPRFAIVTIDSASDTLILGARLAEAVAENRWTAACCLPDAPEKCHTAARIRTIAEAGANVVLFLGAGSAALRESLPETLPIVSWTLSATAVSERKPATGPRDRVAAGSEWIRRQLCDAGAPPDGVALCPPGATIRVDQVPGPRTHDAPGDLRAVLFADCPDDRAQACGLGLASHQRLWETLRQVARTHAMRHAPLDVTQLIDEAQEKSGVRLTDEKLRAHFRTLAASHILPVAEARAAIHTVTAASIGVDMYGMKLDGIEVSGASCRGVIPSVTDAADVLAGADLLVAPLADARTMQWAVDAMAVGTVPICRSGPPAGTVDDAAANLLPKAIQWYSQTNDLVRILKRILGDRAEADRKATEAAQEVRRSHRLADRVRFLHGLVARDSAAVRRDGAVPCRSDA